jgi:hypothetical protein
MMTYMIVFTYKCYIFDIIATFTSHFSLYKSIIACTLL